MTALRNPNLVATTLALFLSIASVACSSSSPSGGTDPGGGLDGGINEAGSDHSTGAESGSSSSGADASQGSSPDGGSSGGCSPGDSVCPKSCANLMTDPDNCGSCEHVCPAGPAGTSPACVSGACTFTCTDASEKVCGGACVSTSTDPANCGACGKVCTINEQCMNPTCSGGACGSSAAADGTDCTVSYYQSCVAGACTPVKLACVCSGGSCYTVQVGADNNPVTSCSCSGSNLVINGTAETGSCTACLDGSYTLGGTSFKVLCFGN